MRREAMNVAFKDPQTTRSLDALAEALLLPSASTGFMRARRFSRMW
jgi:hypothetical protein